MKSYAVKGCLVVVFASLLVVNAEAQRSGRKRTTTTSAGNNQATQQQNNNTQPAYNPYGNIPIVVDSSGISDTAVKKSLRNDNAFDKSSLNARTPLPYEHLRADDALFAEKVWRELDLREKNESSFSL
jgi:hypothetical protein